MLDKNEDVLLCPSRFVENTMVIPYMQGACKLLEINPNDITVDKLKNLLSQGRKKCASYKFKED